MTEFPYRHVGDVSLCLMGRSKVRDVRACYEICEGESDSRVICLADMLSTIWLVQTGRAVEVNPVMKFYLAAGLLAFIGAKSFLWFGPVFVMEVVRLKRRWFGHLLLRTTLVLYLALYCTLVWQVNL